MKGMDWSTGSIIIGTALDSTIKSCYLSCYPPTIKTAAARNDHYCKIYLATERLKCEKTEAKTPVRKSS